MLDNFIRFVTEVRKNVYRTFPELDPDNPKSLTAQELGVLTRNQELHEQMCDRGNYVSGVEYIFCFPRVTRYRDVLKFCLLSWYMPISARESLQEYLLNVIRRNNTFTTEESLLFSFDVCHALFYQEVFCSHSDLFGNILQRGYRKNLSGTSGTIRRTVNEQFYFEIVQPSTYVARKARRKGYDDHGSQATRDQRIQRKIREEYGNANWLKIEQRRINQRITVNQQIQKTLDFLLSG